MGDLLDEAFAFVVAGMGLAGENELDRPLGVLGQLDDLGQLLEDQRGPLIGGESPAKPMVKASGLSSASAVIKSPARRAALQKKAVAAEFDQFRRSS